MIYVDVEKRRPQQQGQGMDDTPLEPEPEPATGSTLLPADQGGLGLDENIVSTPTVVGLPIGPPLEEQYGGSDGATRKETRCQSKQT